LPKKFKDPPLNSRSRFESFPFDVVVNDQKGDEDKTEKSGDKAGNIELSVK